uniref:Rab-GAP TBC domain-containing protein n=1 Tax=Romanomermis culicivorax TaxID=13658 RepID=A0A915KE63_ROMCU
PYGVYIEWSAFETASPSKIVEDANDWVLADSNAGQSKNNGNSSSNNNNNNRMKINLDLKDLRSFELLNENSDTDGSVKLYAKDGTTHAPLHFTMGGCSDFVNTLQKYLSLKRSRKEANLILVCHENAAAYEQSVKVLWKDNSRDFLSRIFADPYGAAYTGLSKLSDFVQDRVSLLPGFLNMDDLDPEQQRNTIQSLLELKKREEESDSSDLLRTHPSTDGFEVVQYALPQRPKISREDPLTFDQWKSHVKDDGSIDNVNQLKSKIFHGGMDPNIRQQVWPFLLGVYPWDSTYEQRQQQKSENQNYYYQKDVARTDRTHKFFEGEQNQNLSTLRDILMTYVMYNFDLGYVQGMSDLLSPIMVVMDNEVDSFWAFVGFMNKIHKNFEMDQKTIKRQLMQLRDLLYVINPSFHNYLETHESDNMYFCFRWILILFKREFNFMDIMRLWEVLWTNLPCENFHLLICAAVLDQQKDLIHVNDLSMRLNLSQLLTSAEAIYHQLSACQHHLPDYVCKHLGFDVEPHTVQNLHKKVDFWAQEAKPPAGGAAPGTVVRRMDVGQSNNKK